MSGPKPQFDINNLIKMYGMESTLAAIVDHLRKETATDGIGYIRKLESDLSEALKNYRSRNDDET